MSEKLKQQIRKFKYPLLALVLGLAIMLMPIGAGKTAAADAHSDEQRLEAVLNKCEGVGSVTVLLSEKGAVIVCAGADDPVTRFAVTKAAEAFTGLTSDRIQILKTAANIGG